MKLNPTFTATSNKQHYLLILWIIPSDFLHLNCGGQGEYQEKIRAAADDAVTGKTKQSLHPSLLSLGARLDAFLDLSSNPSIILPCNTNNASKQNSEA